MTHRPPLRPGQHALAKRIAEKLANVVRELDPKIGNTHLAGLRGLAMHIRALRIRPRQLDQPNGEDAIMAIARTLTPREWSKLAHDNTLTLNRQWGEIVYQAGRLLRRAPKAPASLPPGSTTPTASWISIYR